MNQSGQKKCYDYYILENDQPITKWTCVLNFETKLMLINVSEEVMLTINGTHVKKKALHMYVKLKY